MPPRAGSLRIGEHVCLVVNVDGATTYAGIGDEELCLGKLPFDSETIDWYSVWALGVLWYRVFSNSGFVSQGSLNYTYGWIGVPFCLVKGNWQRPVSYEQAKWEEANLSWVSLTHFFPLKDLDFLDDVLILRRMNWVVLTLLKYFLGFLRVVFSQTIWSNDKCANGFS